MFFFIIMGAHIFGYFFIPTNTTNNIANRIGGLDTSRWMILVVIILG